MLKLFFLLLLVVFQYPASGFAGDSSDFLSVTGPCKIQLPKDHGAHPDYRTEWWYYTGNVFSDEGNQYGFQLTIFRTGISSPSDQKKWPEPASDWRTAHMYMAHASISDINGKRYLHAEKISRGVLGLADATQQAGVTNAYLGNWSVIISSEKHKLAAETDDFTIDFTLTSDKSPVFHGDDGYSRKGSAPERASCYYSYTRLQTKGTLVLDGKKMSVHGLSWMDHEFSTEVLEPGINGWDWFCLQFSDRTELMVFQLRKDDGTIHPASSGTFVDKDGNTSHLSNDDIDIQQLKHWKSPHSGAKYPIQWEMNISKIELQISILSNLNDQEMQARKSLGVVYWEGSVSAGGKRRAQPVTASGYVEMTGYEKPLDVRK